VIHVDPRFTRTQRPGRPALPIRAGTDIVFLAQREAKGIEQ
jgi:anaerobic selenocysteine-containing dehydrogenase